MEAHTDQCPLNAVDRRLEDAHRQWHQAEKGYFEPEIFRVAIQSAIQTLRTVSFILQSNKGVIPGFQSWYQEWQDRLRADPLMRWMVDARNKIEKQGDLELHSMVKAQIIASHLDEGPCREVAANLFHGPAEILASIPDGDVGEHFREHGTLTIERRWVENGLPEYELLDAVGIAYGRLSELVRSAHQQMGLERPATIDAASGHVIAEGERGGRLPCMVGHAEDRTLKISLKDGARLSLVEHAVRVDPEKAERWASEMSLVPEEIFAEAGASALDQLGGIDIQDSQIQDSQTG